MLEKLISNFGPVFSSAGDLVQNAAVVIGRGVMVKEWPNAVVAIEVGVTLLRVRLVMAMMQVKFQ